jgi:hypothetical protein
MWERQLGAVWRYLETERRQALAEDPLFISTGGHQPGTAFTPYGIHQIIARARTAAGLLDVRCSPHSLWRTFARARQSGQPTPGRMSYRIAGIDADRQLGRPPLFPDAFHPGEQSIDG